MLVLKEFQRAIKRYAMLKGGDGVVLGVSGGADSLAMLHLFVEARNSMGVTISVLHMHHGIRDQDADADAAFVKTTCREWKVPCRMVKVNVPALAKKQKLTLEEAARQARYTKLYDEATKRGAASIAVAHNADDQAETVLMHLLRGSGMAGLRGMLPTQTKPPVTVDTGGKTITLIRPLLNVPRADIEAYCAEHDLNPHIDATNVDTAYLRNQIRHEVMPILESINPNVREALGRTASILADDFRQLESDIDIVFDVVAKIRENNIEIDRSAWIKLRPALQRGVIRRGVQAVNGGIENVGYEHIEQAVRVARDSQIGAVSEFPNGLILRVGYGEIRIGPSTRASVGASHPGTAGSDSPLQDATTEIALSVPCNDMRLSGGWKFSIVRYEEEKVTGNRWAAVLELERASDVRLRTRRPGDRFQPQGAGGSQKLSDFMINAKIESEVRDRLPLLVVDGQIAWVCGYRVDQRFIVTPESKKVWLAKFTQSPIDNSDP